jgi:hypothetical protein
MTAQATLQNTLLWFQRARPNPSSKDFHSQLGVHYEEVVESLQALDGKDPYTTGLIAQAEMHLHLLAEHLKASDNVVQPTDEVLFLDSLCDQIVTATGVGHTRGYEIIGAMNEVNRSNFSKFDDNGMPLYNENRKVIKGPNYSKANLTPYVR